MILVLSILMFWEILNVNDNLSLLLRQSYDERHVFVLWDDQAF